MELAKCYFNNASNNITIYIKTVAEVLIKGQSRFSGD